VFFFSVYLERRSRRLEEYKYNFFIIFISF